MKNLNHKLYGIVFAAYIGSGPIYWIPGINVEVITNVKYLMFFFIISWPLLKAILLLRFNFPGGNLVLLSFSISSFLSIPSMLYGEPAASMYKLENTFQIFLFLLSCGFLISNKIDHLVVILAVRVFVFFSILSLALMLIMPFYISPLNEGLFLFQTGLGGSRTTWSPAIAIYFPWLYSGFTILSGLWLWLAIFSMLANQVLVMGRTGIVASVITFIFYAVFKKNIKVFLLVSFATALISFLVIGNLELLKLDVSRFADLSSLDQFSSGRIQRNSNALNEIYSSPFIGVGVDPGTRNDLVHNVILRAAYEGGIPYALSIVGLLTIGLYRGWKNLTNKNWFVFSAFLTVLSGVINSFFEPVSMFGNFNNAAFWWLCFAICVSTRYTKSYQRKQLISK